MLVNDEDDEEDHENDNGDNDDDDADDDDEDDDKDVMVMMVKMINVGRPTLNAKYPPKRRLKYRLALVVSTTTHFHVF
jgi:hypothetical protein